MKGYEGEEEGYGAAGQERFGYKMRRGVERVTTADVGNWVDESEFVATRADIETRDVIVVKGGVEKTSGRDSVLSVYRHTTNQEGVRSK